MPYAITPAFPAPAQAVAASGQPPSSTVRTGRLVLDAIEACGNSAVLALEQIADAAASLAVLQEAARKMAERAALPVAEPTPEDMRKALANGQSLDALFASDPRNLGTSLAEADKLASTLFGHGIALDEELAYPVIVITAEGADGLEKLVWMNASQRAALDDGKHVSEPGFPGCAARTGVDGAKSARYVCLDSQANRRIAPASLQPALEALMALIGARRDLLAGLQSSLSGKLEQYKSLLVDAEKVLVKQERNETLRQEKREERALEENEALYRHAHRQTAHDEKRHRENEKVRRRNLFFKEV